MWLLAASPLIVVTGILFPFTLPRAAWMLGFGILCIISGIVASKRMQPLQLTLIDYAYTAFTAVLVLTALTGVDAQYSFWSDTGRAMGVAYLVIVYFVYAVGRLLDWQPVEWRRFWYVTTATFVGALAVGVLQALNSDFLPTTTGDRVGGPLGNALIFGTYIAPMCFIIAALIAEKAQFGFSNFFAKYVLPGALILAVIILFITKTRSSLLGLGVGAVVFVLGTVFNAKTNNAVSHLKKPLLGALLVGVIAYGALFVYARTSQNSTLLRVTFSTTDSVTLKTRLLNWRIAVASFKDHPILGWGWENYRVATDLHFDPQLSSYSYYETRIDKPHNGWLELLVTTGIVGFIVYLTLLVFALISLLRGAAQGKIHPAAAWALIGALVAHEVQNFFAFDTHTTIWTLMTIFLWAASIADVRGRDLSDVWNKMRKPVSVVATIAGAGLIVYGIWAPLYNAYYAQVSLDGLEAHNIPMIDVAYRATETAIAGPYEFDTWRWTAHALLYNFASKSDNITTIPISVRAAWNEDVQSVARHTAELASAHPNSSEWLLFTGKIDYYLAIVLDDTAYLDKSQQLFERSFVLAPHRQEPVLLLSYVHALRGDNTRSVDALITARKIAPSAEAVQTLDFIAGRLEKEKDYTNAVRLFEYWVTAYPTAPNFASLAAAYASMHRYGDARAAVAHAVELDPTFASDADIFLKTLPK